MALKKLVAGNWKMHGLAADLGEIRAIAEASADYPQVDVALCVPTSRSAARTSTTPKRALTPAPSPRT